MSCCIRLCIAEMGESTTSVNTFSVNMSQHGQQVAGTVGNIKESVVDQQINEMSRSTLGPFRDPFVDWAGKKWVPSVAQT